MSPPTAAPAEPHSLSPDALLLACHRNDEEAALALLSSPRAQLLLAVSDPTGLTSLLAAAKHASVRLVNALLEQGAKLTESTHAAGNHALHLAAAHGCLPATQALVNAHRKQAVPVDCRNAHLDTPLMFAASAGHLGVAAVLVKAGADIQAANADGVTSALAGACHQHVLQLLLKAGDPAVLLAARDVHGNSVLHLACRSGSTEAVELLLKWPYCPVTERNLRGRTPLDEARLSGSQHCICLLEAAWAALDSEAQRHAAALLQEAGPATGSTVQQARPGGASAEAPQPPDGSNNDGSSSSNNTSLTTSSTCSGTSRADAGIGLGGSSSGGGGGGCSSVCSSGGSDGGSMQVQQEVSALLLSHQLQPSALPDASTTAAGASAPSSDAVSPLPHHALPHLLAPQLSADGTRIAEGQAAAVHAESGPNSRWAGGSVQARGSAAAATSAEAAAGASGEGAGAGDGWQVYSRKGHHSRPAYEVVQELPGHGRPAAAGPRPRSPEQQGVQQQGVQQPGLRQQEAQGAARCSGQAAGGQEASEQHVPAGCGVSSGPWAKAVLSLGQQQPQDQQQQQQQQQPQQQQQTTAALPLHPRAPGSAAPTHEAAAAAAGPEAAAAPAAAPATDGPELGLPAGAAAASTPAQHTPPAAAPAQASAPAPAAAPAPATTAAGHGARAEEGVAVGHGARTEEGAAAGRGACVEEGVAVGHGARAEEGAGAIAVGQDPGALQGVGTEAVATVSDHVLWQQCPEAEALGLMVPHALGLGLDGLSMSQIEALEAFHRAALAQLADAKVTVVRLQERQRAAHESQLALEIAAVAARLQ